MKRKLLSFILLPAVLTTACTSCEGTGGEEEGPVTGPQTELAYDVLGLGEIPIGIWVTPPPAYQTESAYADIRACGMNFINGFMYNENSNAIIKKVLDYCEKNGMKYFANKSTVSSAIREYAESPDDELLSEFVNGIKTYADHPAYAGELLIDEPPMPLFEALSAFTDIFDRIYPEKMWHVNLFPTYATGGIQAPSYEEYINEWFNVMSPSYISYDSYPLLTDGTIIDDYFYNLDLIRTKTRFREIPFWTFIQTLSIAGTPGVPDKREPSEADIRWQVWTDLAFGAKGIQYFCYWSPGNGSEQFGEALVGLDGQKTIRYDYVRKLNADINEIGKILLNCHAEGVIQNASGKTYDLFSPLYSFGPVESVSGDDCLVGCFSTEEGDSKVLITPLLPTSGARVVLDLAGHDGIVKVWKNAEASETDVTSGRLEFDIPAGDAVFVEF